MDFLDVIIEEYEELSRKLRRNRKSHEEWLQNMSASQRLILAKIIRSQERQLSEESAMVEQKRQEMFHLIDQLPGASGFNCRGFGGASSSGNGGVGSEVLPYRVVHTYEEAAKALVAPASNDGGFKEQGQGINEQDGCSLDSKEKLPNQEQGQGIGEQDGCSLNKGLQEIIANGVLCEDEAMNLAASLEILAEEENEEEDC